MQVIRSENKFLSLSAATGPLPYRLTNDYLFRALLQENNKALKGLICSLLHLRPSEIFSVVIMNPIELGTSITEKTFFLDIKIMMNDHTIINLEMQVLNTGNWPERSLSYLCRSFDHLNKGQNYSEVKPVIHIGLLDFTLFPDHPEFYATYKLMNVKNHTIYSDKFRLSVLDLNCIDLATQEDKAYQIDYWAELFKAETWEEIKMLAAKNEYVSEASQTLYKLSAEEKIRLQCEAQEDYYRNQRDMECRQQKTMNELLLVQSKLNDTRSELNDAKSELNDTKNELNSTKSELDSTKGALDRTKKELTASQKEIARLQAELAALKN